MKIELKNGEIINTISDFNFSIHNCLSCKYKIITIKEEFNYCNNDCDYEFVGIKSIEMKVKTDE